MKLAAASLFLLAPVHASRVQYDVESIAEECAQRLFDSSADCEGTLGGKWAVILDDAAANDYMGTPGCGKWTVRNDHLEADIMEETQRLMHRNNQKRESWFDDYHPLEELTVFYADAAVDHSNIVTFVPRISEDQMTWEGRNISAVHITDKSVPGNKPIVYIQANIHAREWISPAATQYFFNELVTRHSAGDDKVLELLRTVEFVIMPSVNPDGYHTTWNGDRLWRKNRLVVSGQPQGVDLNRNYDDNWGGPGSSGVPSSQTYRGPGVFSEPETVALAQYYQGLGGRMIAAVDVHSFGNLILRPLTGSSANPDNFELLKACGDGVRDRILEVNPSRGFTSGSWFEDLYVSSGVSQDWFYSNKLNTVYRPYSFTWELEGTPGGFVLPPQFIIPVGTEIAEAFFFLADFAIANKLPPMEK